LFASFKDIIGIVKSVGELSNIVVKSTGKDLLKREIQIVDDSNCAINATLWGKQVRLLF
jgi:replication factor A1